MKHKVWFWFSLYLLFCFSIFQLFLQVCFCFITFCCFSSLRNKHDSFAQPFYWIWMSDITTDCKYVLSQRSRKHGGKQNMYVLIKSHQIMFYTVYRSSLETFHTFHIFVLLTLNSLINGHACLFFFRQSFHPTRCY